MNIKYVHVLYCVEYYTDENFTEALKDILDHLTEPMEIQSIEFRPSLTPQSSYIKSIISVRFLLVVINLTTNHVHDLYTKSCM